MSEHKHQWETRYEPCGSGGLLDEQSADGMICECGQILEQEHVEKLINGMNIYTGKDGDLLYDEYDGDGCLSVVYAK